MKIFKKFICAMFCAMLIFAACGCNALKLNEEKDLSSTVAEVDGQKYTKQQFLNYYNAAVIVYENYGYTVPTGEEEVKAYKKSMLTEYTENIAIKSYCEANAIEPEKRETDAVEDLIKLVKEKQADYAAYLEGYGFTEETFKAALSEYVTLSDYYSAFTSADIDHSFMFDGYALKVGDREVSPAVFHYYTVCSMLLNYVNNKTYPSSEEDLLTYYDSMKNFYVGYYYALYDYALKNGYTITNDDVEEALVNFDTVTMYLGNDSVNAQFAQYFLGKTEIEEARKEMGEVMAYEKKVSEDFKNSYEPTEEELVKYYENGKDTTFGDKVSAYHILTEDKARAEELLKESKGTAEGFMKIFEKYSASASTDESIKEAADLGSFYYKAMVPEFSEAAFSMEVGEVKGMVQTEHGYHLIYVYDKTPAVTLEADHDKVLSSYLAANGSAHAYNQTDEIYKTYKIKEGNYRQTPQMILDSWLKNSFKIKTYPNVASR